MASKLGRKDRKGRKTISGKEEWKTTKNLQRREDSTNWWQKIGVIIMIDR